MTPTFPLGATQELQMETIEYTSTAPTFSASAFYHLEPHYRPLALVGCFSLLTPIVNLDAFQTPYPDRALTPTVS